MENIQASNANDASGLGPPQCEQNDPRLPKMVALFLLICAALAFFASFAASKLNSYNYAATYDKQGGYAETEIQILSRTPYTRTKDKWGIITRYSFVPAGSQSAVIGQEDFEPGWYSSEKEAQQTIKDAPATKKMYYNVDSPSDVRQYRPIVDRYAASSSEGSYYTDSIFFFGLGCFLLYKRYKSNQFWEQHDCLSYNIEWLMPLKISSLITILGGSSGYALIRAGGGTAITALSGMTLIIISFFALLYTLLNLKNLLLSTPKDVDQKISL